MGKEFINGPLGTYTRERSKRMSVMVTERCFGMMDLSTKGSGKMGFSMGMVR